MYRIEEFPEIWADACLRDSEGRLVFISLYGRDGSLMQLLAAIELSASERGVQHFHLVGPQDERHRVDVASSDRLAKHAGKLPRQNLFGPLNQMWLFDKSLQKPDRANRIGWALSHSNADACTPEQASSFRDKLWQLIKLLSPVALEPGWRDSIFEWCGRTGAVQRLNSTLYPAIGPVQAMRVGLTDHFAEFISSSVRQGVLKLTDAA